MESIHGVDVSWLHRPTHGMQQPTVSAPRVPQILGSENGDKKERLQGENDEKPRTMNGVSQTPPQPHSEPIKKESRRPGILHRSQSANPPTATAQDDAKSPPRKSWMSSLTSKLSSQNTKPTHARTGSDVSNQAPPLEVATQTPQTPRMAPPQSVQSTKPREPDDPAMEEAFATPDSTQPTSPKPTNQSFFSSALRRLSTSNVPQQPLAGTAGLQPQCERRILNIDEGRPRCSVQGLDQAKLRRVSFSVDVEIAGSSRYTVEEDDETPGLEDKKTKRKDKKLKERGEGEAMKHPDAAVKVKEKKGDLDAGVSQLRPQSDFDGTKGQRAAEVGDSGSGPATMHLSTRQDSKHSHSTEPIPRPHADTDPGQQPPSAQESTKPLDRPTTDPLRIYRRCCQLREAPVLKRISEQLGNPSNVGLEAPGVVTCLNLNRSRLQLTDVICLGDWLAVVPVKKLLFDEANLTDEGVRVVLAGLLAAKPPELHKRKRGRSSPTRLRDSSINRSPGVIEKLTLKGNKRLTVESWKHICLFLNLCQSIKACDLSGISFPRSQSRSSTDAEAASKRPQDLAELLHASLTNRLGGDGLQELTLNQCDLDDYHVSKIATAASNMRLSRLGLGGNQFSGEGLRHIATYLRAGVCRGLDLAGVNLHDKLPIILDAISPDEPLQALSLAQCSLDPLELKELFSKLVSLSDFRFIDLSHNHKLFSAQPSALSTLRQYLPKLKLLKRIHLMDVSMSPADVIGIAEIVPEIRNLAHLNILENPQLKATVTSNDSTSSEEACALFASLMTAVRLSKTLVCVDVDVPGENATEVVRALARQVVAYCLRNLESFAQGDAVRVTDAAAALPDVAKGGQGVLQDIVGHREQPRDDDQIGLPASAKHEDFLVGGQGWVKALSYCLNAADLRRMSADGTTTPSQVLQSEAGKAQAKEMSKDLLVSARVFRTRLETVLRREEASSNADFDVLNRLKFLDHTILSIIERFEREFPETKLPSDSATGLLSPLAAGDNEPIDFTSPTSTAVPAYSPFFNTDNPASDYPSPTSQDSPISGSRRGSATDTAAFAQASEEAKFHRFGQRFRREVLPPRGQDDLLHGTTKDQTEPLYDAELRRRIENLDSGELGARINRLGYDAVIDEIQKEREILRKESLAGTSGDGTSGEVVQGPYKPT